MPKSWDRVVEQMTDDETVRMRVKAPGNDEDWKEQWGCGARTRMEMGRKRRCGGSEGLF